MEFDMMPNVETQKRIIDAWKVHQDEENFTEDINFWPTMMKESKATRREIILTLSLTTNPMALVAYAAWLEKNKP